MHKISPWRVDRIGEVHRSVPIKVADIPTVNKYGDLQELRRRNLISIVPARYEKDDMVVPTQLLLFGRVEELFC